MMPGYNHKDCKTHLMQHPPPYNSYNIPAHDELGMCGMFETGLLKAVCLAHLYKIYQSTTTITTKADVSTGDSPP